MSIPVGKPTLVMLHGPVACGKLTIARELAATTGFALFHNHLTVDMLLALFPFGSPEFVRYREQIWLELIPAAIAVGRSTLFTFNPEKTVSPAFPDTLRAGVEKAGGRALFVEVRCSPEAILQRMETDSRRQMRKLTSVELYQRLESEGAFHFPPIRSDYAVDSSANAPLESARSIIAALNLPTRARESA